jgi:hypothetical protein
MVYNTWDYWVFGFSYSKEHIVLETGSVSVLRWRGETYFVGSVRKNFIQ